MNYCPICQKELHLFFVYKIQKNILWSANLQENTLTITNFNNPSIQFQFKENLIPTNSYLFYLCNPSIIQSHHPCDFNIPINLICYYKSFYPLAPKPNKECFRLDKYLIQCDHTQNNTSLFFQYLDKSQHVTIPNFIASTLLSNHNKLLTKIQKFSLFY